MVRPLPCGRCEQTTGTTFHTNFKEFQTLKCPDLIWNHREKYIQISTNMPGIGPLIREIDVTISEIGYLSKHFFFSVKPRPAL